MVRILLALGVCLVLASEAHAVQLLDGEAVGKLMGATEACTKNTGIRINDKEGNQIGPKYAQWLKSNSSHAARIAADVQTGMPLGMANAAMTNYGICESTLSEMIGFYQHFGATGAAFQPILNYYKEKSSVSVRENDPITAEERDDFLAFDREQQKQEALSKAAPASEEDMGPELPLGQLGLKDDYTTATMKLRFNSDGDLMMMIKSTSSNKVACNFEGMCEVQNGVVLVCTQFVDGKEMIATGEFGDTAIELLPSSTKSICAKGGVIDGSYILKK